MAARVTINERVYEGRVPSLDAAVFAVMRKEEMSDLVNGNEPMLIGVERICGARHAKMTKVSEE